MPRAHQKARSESNESFGNSDDEGTVLNGTSSGRKSNSKDVDQRKEQNRIAQREFRQRKQQYIKGLEARLQLHESSRDEQLDQMRTGVRALIDENQKLRELLASVAGFIGEGLGGVLPKLGVDVPEFQDLISRSKTEFVLRTLDAHQKHRNEASGSGAPPLKRLRMDDPSPIPQDDNLRASTSTPAGHSFRDETNFNTGRGFVPPAVPLLPAPMDVAYGSHTQPALQTPSPMDAGIPGRLSEREMAGKRTEARGTEAWEIIRERVATGPYDSASIEDHEDTIQNLFSMPTDNPKLQAIQLISYHMRNKRENNNYHLPPSLRATVTQQSVPHSPLFDGIIFSSLRDRLILLKDQYDSRTLMMDLVEAIAIHEDDILLPANWELSEHFLRKYWYVVDQEVLTYSNRWRKERGEPELTLREIVPDGSDIVAEGVLGKKPRESI